MKGFIINLYRFRNVRKKTKTMQKQKKIEPRLMSGFMELLPGEQIAFNKMLGIVRETYEDFGFIPMDTPVIEMSEILFAKIGEDTKKEIYRFTRGDDDLSLRFDLTVPLARYVALNQGELNFPFRRYQIGKVYRGERPQKGRFRELYQCDIDIIGRESLNLINDAEIPAVIYRLFSRFNIGEFVIRVNNRKILNGLVESLGWPEKIDEVLRIVDKLEKIGQESVKEELVNLGISLNGVMQILQFVRIVGSNKDVVAGLRGMKVVNKLFDEGVRELEYVVEKAMEFGVPEKNIQVDLSIARGLSYYTGTVYETKMVNERIVGSVCGGGRYDNLAESYSDISFPGVGISVGLTRLFSQLMSAGMVETKRSSLTEVLVAPMSEDIAFALEVANKLRESGINAEVYADNDKFRKKMNYANKAGIPFVGIIGGDEIAQRKISLKNMTTGDQRTVFLEEAVKIVKENE